MLIASYMKLKSKELVKILKQREEVNKEIQKIHKVLVEADTEHKKLQHKVQRLKDKGVKILDKVIKEQTKLDEFDYTGQMESIDDELFEIDVHNVFTDMFKDPESIKKKLREDKKDKIGVWADELMFVGHNK